MWTDVLFAIMKDLIQDIHALNVYILTKKADSVDLELRAGA